MEYGVYVPSIRPQCGEVLASPWGSSPRVILDPHVTVTSLILEDLFHAVNNNLSYPNSYFIHNSSYQYLVTDQNNVH